MLMTFDVSPELATRLHPFEQQLSQVLELGLHEFNTPKQQGFKGINDILEFLASMPTPEEMIALRPYEALQTKVNQLLEKQQYGILNDIEQQQWQQCEYVEHLVRTAKANALLKSQGTIKI